VPWAAGFVAYQLTTPTYFSGGGWTPWWTDRQANLHLTWLTGQSASLVSLAVAAVLTLVVLAPRLTRGSR
jgi:hypothetical protein